jgi:hypothetical protein
MARPLNSLAHPPDVVGLPILADLEPTMPLVNRLVVVMPDIAEVPLDLGLEKALYVFLEIRLVSLDDIRS